MTLELTAGPTKNGLSNNGNRPQEDTPLDLEASAYLRFLPAVYGQDSFMGRFLRIFEDILSPIQNAVTRRAELFDVTLTSTSLLSFLSTWVGADELGDVPEARMRLLVRKAVVLNQLRGTKGGLRLALEVITGRRPYITEHSPGLVLGDDAVLGLNTSLDDGAPLRFYVRFDCDQNEINAALAHAIIQRYKPAGAVYTLTFA